MHKRAHLNGGWSALLFFTAVFASQAQTLTTLVNFSGPNGAGPQVMSLIQGVDGDLYGTTAYGGANNEGTIFSITPGGKLTTLYDFCSGGKPCLDGAQPFAGLVQATNGDFYGTTESGGKNGPAYCPAGCFGTVFKITSAGALTTLYSFCAETLPDGACADGLSPVAPLIQSASGDLFGTTPGTVFEITPEGELTTLYKVGRAESGVIQATDGNFYGTTQYGTNLLGGNPSGSIFKIHPGAIHETLYTFCEGGPACADGAEPLGGLLQATDGDLYGTTTAGGRNCENGTIFKITMAGALTTLYSFCSQGNGTLPSAGLIQATDGNFYGTTRYGGAGYGTIFRLTPEGVLTTLHRFTSNDGGIPSGGLLQATNGSLYGTTTTKGVGGDGTLFKLDMGLGPFVKTLPASARVGQDIKILGTNLTGATSVTFNGSPADFTVNSAGTSISTTVPAGATTGKVHVITPGGILLSNIDFRVAP